MTNKNSEIPNKETEINLINEISIKQKGLNGNILEKKETSESQEKKEYNEIILNEKEVNKNNENENIVNKVDINLNISDKKVQNENSKKIKISTNLKDILENLDNKVKRDKMKNKDTNKIIKINENEALKKIEKNENEFNKNIKNEDNINIIKETKLSLTNNGNNNISDNKKLLQENKEDFNICNDIKDKEINTSIENMQFKKSKLFDRDELYVNLIYFDYNITKKEQFSYYNNFQVDVVGAFHLTIFKNYLESLKKKKIPFIVLSSESSMKDILTICLKYSFIKEVIIFCKNYKKNEHYLKEYPGYVKKALTSIKSIYEYIKTFEGDFKEVAEKYKNEDKYIFSYEEIQKNKQLKQYLVITANEYDRFGYLIPKIYSNFFGDINDKNEKFIFNNNNLNKIYECLDKVELGLKEKEKISQIFNFLFNLKDNDSFIEESIRSYISEDCFCYLFDIMMRNYEKGLISFAYYMGPLLYGLNKYVKDNIKFAILENKKLYKIIECSNLDFYLYKLNIGHIICFPSFTLTSSKEIEFQPSNLTKNINTNLELNETVKIKMIFKYKYKKGNISPGIIIEKNKGKDGRYLSKYADNEILLFPYTFVRIKKIKSKKEKGNKIQVIELEIINRTSYIEYILKTDDKNRILFSKLD